MSGTETIDPRNAGLDMWPDEAILDALLDGQRRAVSAVEAARDALALTASAIAARLGTSGRIVWLDSSGPRANSRHSDARSRRVAVYAVCRPVFSAGRIRSNSLYSNSLASNIRYASYAFYA